MNKIQKLLKKFCPDGVEYKKLGEVVLKNTFKQIGASELETMIIAGGG